MHGIKKLFSIYNIRALIGLCKKPSPPSASSLLEIRHGMRIRPYSEIHKEALIRFMNRHNVTTVKMDNISFAKYITGNKYFKKDDFAVVFKGPRIVAVALIEEDRCDGFDDFREAIISVFFVDPAVKNDTVNSCILDYLFETGRKKRYSRLRIQKSPSGIFRTFKSDSGTIAAFLKKGFISWGEVDDMVVRAEGFHLPANIGNIKAELERSGIKIRNYETADHDSLTNLLKTEFPFWMRHVKRIVAKRGPDLSLLVAERDKTIIGFRGHFLGGREEFMLCQLKKILGEISGYNIRTLGCLHLLGIQKEWRHRGIGTVLTAKAMEELFDKQCCEIIVYTVVPSFFRRFGFDTIEKYATMGYRLCDPVRHVS